MSTVPPAAPAWRRVPALRALLVTLLVVAAAAGATLANVSLLGNAARSGDPIGRLTPTSFPATIVPARSARAGTRDHTRAQPLTSATSAPSLRTNAGAAHESHRNEHRSGSRADD